MKVIYILIFALLFSACSDFLEEKSQDLRIPKSVVEYKELIFGECLDNEMNLCSYLDVMSDDVTEAFTPNSSVSGDYRTKHWAYYTWQNDPELGKGNVYTSDDAWKEYYSRILLCNIIVDKIEEMEGKPEEKIDIEAEACFVNTYSYFMLANLYGQPYIDENSAKTDPCVPLNYETGIVDKIYERSTVSEVYEEMEKNILRSIELFKKSALEKTIFRPNLDAAYLLASRVFLFQKKYAEAKKYADTVLMNNGDRMQDMKQGFHTPFFSKYNPEILFSFGHYYNSGYEAGVKAQFGPSEELMNTFDEGDQRKEAFFNMYDSPRKWYDDADAYGISFRVAEAYLNRAEASVELDKLDIVKSDIEAIRQNRIEDYAVELNSKDEARAIVRKERRSELCFEGFRWFDLRRWERPEIKHSYSNEEGHNTAVYTLKANSKAYTLPAPKNIIDRNPILDDNERPDRDNGNSSNEDN